jgi:hypothetical protein
MNGYIKITINGQEVGLKFAYPAIKEFTLAAAGKKDLYLSNDSLSDFGIAKLIHCGYKNNCELLEVNPSLTLSQVSDWVEEALDNPKRIDELAQILEVYADSRYTKLAMQQLASQKKSPPKKAPTRKAKK